MAYVGLARVGPWVRVDPGGGSPRPWEKQGLRLGLGVLALAPEGSYVPLVLGGVPVPRVGLAIVMLAAGSGLVLGMVAPGPERIRG